jgi:hypothetical protein
MKPIGASDLLSLLVLALPIAAIAWTVTHEELFREFHDYCVARSEKSKRFLPRKFFYLFTCEYCFSHYVSAAILLMTRFTLLYDDWRGWVITWFALVWVANHLISVFGRLRLGIRSERLEIGLKEAVTEQAKSEKHDDRAQKPRRAS